MFPGVSLREDHLLSLPIIPTARCLENKLDGTKRGARRERERERDTILVGGMETLLPFEGSQATPASPSDKG
jgi:hypothetical protein